MKAIAVGIVVLLTTGCVARQTRTPASEAKDIALPPTEDALYSRVDAITVDLQRRAATYRAAETISSGEVPIPVLVEPSRPAMRTDRPAMPSQNPATAAQFPRTQLEQMRDRAERSFGPQLGAVVQRLEAIDHRMASLGPEIRAACSGTTFGSSTDYFSGTTNIIALDNSTTPQCRVAASRVRTEITEPIASVRQGLDALNTAAIQSGIYPGVMRDLFGQYSTICRLIREYCPR